MWENMQKFILGKTPTEFSRFLWLKGQTAFSINCKLPIYVRVFGNDGEAVRGVLDAGWAERVLILPFLFALSPSQSGKLVSWWLLSFTDLKVLLQEDRFIICLCWCNFGFLKKKRLFLFVPQVFHIKVQKFSRLFLWCILFPVLLF